MTLRLIQKILDKYLAMKHLLCNLVAILTFKLTLNSSSSFLVNLFVEFISKI